MTKSILEKAVGVTLEVPKSKKGTRESCDCLIGNDIGAYNTCDHACVYCYANYNRKTVVNNIKLHAPTSPMLVGNLNAGDKVTDAKQVSYYCNQLSLF